MIKTDAKAYLQNLLQEKIAIINKMGLQVVDYNQEQLKLKTPLDLNINDKGSAFAGSIYSTLVLTGWGIIVLKLLESNIEADVMVYEGNIVYRKPIANDFTTVNQDPGPGAWQDLINQLKTRNRGKIRINVDIIENNKPIVAFEGNYCALFKESHQ